MLITFYDYQGIVDKEFVPEGENINGESYLTSFVVKDCFVLNLNI